jgi:hypothetical protein
MVKAGIILMVYLLVAALLVTGYCWFAHLMIQSC